MQSAATSTIQDIAAGLHQLCEDEQDRTTVSFTDEPIEIRELFDFSNTYWEKMIQDKAGKGLDDELELYELLDLDAEGEAVDGESTLAY